MNFATELLALALYACDGQTGRLAVRLDVSRGTVENWRRSPESIRARHLAALAEVAGKSIALV